MSELSPEQISKLTNKVIEDGYSLTRSECLLVLEALADATTRATTAEAERDDLQISLRKIIAELIRVQITANELRVERDTAATRVETAEAEWAGEVKLATTLQELLAIAREEAMQANAARDDMKRSADSVDGAWKLRCASLEAQWGKLREEVAKMNGDNPIGPLYGAGICAARDRVLSLIYRRQGL